MNTHELRLKLTIHEAALDAGERPHTARQAAAGVMEHLDDDDGPREVAAKALLHLCTDDGNYNNCTFGLKAVLRFLGETIPEDRQPADDDALHALGRLLLGGGCTQAAFRRWVYEWYPDR